VSTPLEDLESICADIFGRWDRDMRAGKLLLALEGRLQRYDPRVDRVRDALASATEARDAMTNGPAYRVDEDRT
jgi:hypothetical protein